MLSVSQVFADATNCRPAREGDHIDIVMNFDITNSSTSITPGTTLASMNSSFISLTCEFTGIENNIYFKSTMPENIKNMLINNGVDVFQRLTVGGNGVDNNITLPTVPDIHLGYWDQPDVGLDKSFAIRYFFAVKKNTVALKAFDTGVFQLGYHINDQGQNIGAPIYARFIGNLTLLCPTPKVNITASNGGSVDFGTVEPRSLYDGSKISKNFNLNMAVTPDCKTGLNISVRFEPNNNTILDNKNLDMSNGLQVLLSNSSGDINYNEPYYIGEVLPFTPVNLPYTATLSHIPGRNIVSGQFTKTIRVVVSY
jgi:hypothetical protein